MKIAVCGKGGCGKSTITSLLSKELAKRGNQVLVIDSDESNYGLHKQLGLELPGDFTEYFGGKQTAFKSMMSAEVLKQMKLSAFAKKFFTEEWSLEDIPDEYCSKKDGVKLLASGKIHQANEGCACTMGAILKELLANLKLQKNEYAIVDMEAGIEHFGRGVDNSADLIMMIVDPSYESIRLTEKIAGLSESIDKPIVFCLNRITAENREFMLKQIRENYQVVGIMSMETQILQNGMEGKELTPDYDAISKMADWFEKQQRINL